MPDTRTLDIVIHGARAELPELRAAVAWARDLGHEVRAHVTWEAGDARRFAAEAAARGTDAVLAVGGDGTVNEVINGLVGTGTALGIVPAGTANDFAHQVGIPDDPREAIALVLETRPLPLDLGTLNGRAFLNVSSAGIGAETTAETGAMAKGVFGTLAYAITGVRKLAGEYEGRRARFTAPDFHLDSEFLVFAVGNARVTGAGTVMTPLAEVDDGLLDLCIVEPRARTDFARLVLQIRRGEHLQEAGVHYVQVPWLRVESDEPLTVNVDGEPSTMESLAYGVLPRALRVHLREFPQPSETPVEPAAES